MDSRATALPAGSPLAAIDMGSNSFRLEIGQLSSVEVEALRFCFDAVTRATLAEGARLEIDTVPGAGWCMMCSASVPLPALYEACPRCGGYQVQPTAGTEMRVKDLEVD